MESRGKRITKEQKFMLIQYLEDHPEFARDRFVNDTGSKSLKDQWTLLSIRLNACGGAEKNGDGWKKAWMNMRSKTKQKSQHPKNAMERSGVNGNISGKELSDMDERIIGVMSTFAIVGQEVVGEPLRRSGEIHSVNMFEAFNEDVEFIEERIVNRTESPEPPIEERYTRPPRIGQPPRRKNPSLEETSSKMLRLEEKKIEIEEAKLAEKRRKSDILEKRNELLEVQNSIEREKTTSINLLSIRIEKLVEN